MMDHTSNTNKNVYIVQKLTFSSYRNSEITYFECFQCIIMCLLLERVELFRFKSTLCRIILAKFSTVKSTFCPKNRLFSLPYLQYMSIFVQNCSLILAEM